MRENESERARERGTPGGKLRSKNTICCCKNGFSLERSGSCRARRRKETKDRLRGRREPITCKEVREQRKNDRPTNLISFVRTREEGFPHCSTSPSSPFFASSLVPFRTVKFPQGIQNKMYSIVLRLPLNTISPSTTQYAPICTRACIHARAHTQM